MNQDSDFPDLADFPVVISLPIQWGDQDAFGHVNNTVPVRWLESARIAYLERTELEAVKMAGGIGPILAAVHCNYRRQLAYPDTVHIGARVSRLGRTSMTMEHRIYSAGQQTMAVEGESVIVVFDYAAQRPVRIPAGVRQAVEVLEGRSFSS